MSGGGMEAEALCFSVYGASSGVLFPFPGESVLAASCVAWAGCRAGGSPFEASAQGVRFHDGFSWFCLLAASDVRSSLAARRLHATEGIALFGAVPFCCAG